MALFLALAAPARATPAEVAFVTPDGIYAMRATGSDRRLLVAGEDASSPAWSPDGTRLAYVKDGRIVIDGRDITSPDKDAHDSAPAWTPDGRTLAFSRSIERRDTDERSQRVLYDIATGR